MPIDFDLSNLSKEQLRALAQSAQEQEKLLDNAEKEVIPAIETLRKYSSALTPEHIAQINKIVASKAPASGKAAKGRKDRVPAPAKYRLPTGETWSGRGRNVPAAFQAWADSPEGKKWQKENPGQKYPPV